jgi:cell division protein FtsI/penicillin-binding protein 2
MLAFLLMSVRLFVVQIVEGPRYADLAVAQRHEVVEFPARRGSILDRDGRPLALSVNLQTVFADPTLIDEPRQAADKLSRILGADPEDLEEVLRGTSPGSRFEYVARQVQPAVAREIEALRLEGVFMRPEAKRMYPNGSLAAHVLGFVNIDGEPQEGIEVQYDDILEGRPGRMTLEEDPGGRPLPQAEFSYRPPRPGDSLLLTIDKDIQHYTEVTLADAVRRYGASAGTAIVMRPATGEILAMANLPRFDPSSPGEFPASARRNRALTDVYEPGSVYKIVTVAAALQERVVKPSTTFVVPPEMRVADRVIHDSHSHPTETMAVRDIIRESSNVGTVMIGQALGAEKLDAYVRRFGFGTPTGLDFPGESPGIVLPLESWSGSSIANIPIGQGVAVTPIQMLSAFATMANRGKWVEPKLLYETVDSDGNVRSGAPSTRRIVSRRVARQMTEMLGAVVAEGTGIEAQVAGYRVAGKTGTAQKPLSDGRGYGDEYVASFGGYAPLRRPQVVALVVLDNPDPIWGGMTAAPTFKLIVGHALRELGVPPSDAQEAVQQAETAVEPSQPVRD